MRDAGRLASNGAYASFLDAIAWQIAAICPGKSLIRPGVNHRPRRLPLAKTIYAELFACPAQLSPQAPSRWRGRPGLVPMSPPVAIPRGIQSPAVKKNPATRPSPAKIPHLRLIRLISRTQCPSLRLPRCLRPRPPKRPSQQQRRRSHSPRPATVTGQLRASCSPPWVCR